MNPAEVATSLLIERTLQDSPAYRKIDDQLYVIKQGSAYVMISVVPWGDNKAMVRCTSQLVKGVDVDGPLAKQLLELNSHLRFGAFAWEPAEQTRAVHPHDPRRHDARSRGADGDAARCRADRRRVRRQADEEVRRPANDRPARRSRDGADHGEGPEGLPVRDEGSQTSTTASARARSTPARSPIRSPAP